MSCSCASPEPDTQEAPSEGLWNELALLSLDVLSLSLCPLCPETLGFLFSEPLWSLLFLYLDLLIQIFDLLFVKTLVHSLILSLGSALPPWQDIFWVTYGSSLFGFCICLLISACPSILNPSSPQSCQILPTSTPLPLPFSPTPTWTPALQPSQLSSALSLPAHGLPPPWSSSALRIPRFRFSHAPTLGPH